MKTLFKALFFIGLFFLTFSKPVPAADYYVSLTGNDSSSGIFTQPWKTIQKAADAISAGDTVIIQAGNYSERVHVTKSGSTGAPITFQAQGKVVMNGFTVGYYQSATPPANYITIKGFEITNTIDNWQDGAGIFIYGSNCVLEDNYIYDTTWEGILFYADPSDSPVTSNCQVRNNRLYHNSQNGITVQGQNHLIEYNEVWDSIQYYPKITNSPNWLDADGMRYFGSGHTFRKNYIHDIKFDDVYNLNPHIDCFQTWTGIDAIAGSNILFEKNTCIIPVAHAVGETGTGFMINGASNLIIKNNFIKAFSNFNLTNSNNVTIINNTLTSDLSLNTSFYPAGVSLGNSPNITIKNNLFYDLPGHTIFTDIASIGLQAGKNLSFRSDGQPLWITNTYSHALDLWGVDPKLVNPSLGDYHLQSNSPAVDAGYNPGTLVADDFDGISRPQGAGYDIGAYEYVSDTPTASVTPITVGDLNSDGKIDVFDLLILLSNFRSADTKYDLNKDGGVNVFDGNVLVGNFGK